MQDPRPHLQDPHRLSRARPAPTGCRVNGGVGGLPVGAGPAPEQTQASTATTAGIQLVKAPDYSPTTTKGISP